MRPETMIGRSIEERCISCGGAVHRLRRFLNLQSGRARFFVFRIFQEICALNGMEIVHILVKKHFINSIKI